MEAHEHHHDMTQKQESWIKTHKWLSYIAIAAIAYYLLAEHREHILPFLPYLFLGACLFGHSFMHGGHGGHGSQHNHSQEKEKEKKS